jgi:Leucine-rich repeat (LRR) protein
VLTPYLAIERKSSSESKEIMPAEQDDMKAKERARASARASQPGAVSVAAEEAARLDQRIAEKQQQGKSEPPAAAAASASSNQDDVAAKQRGARSSATPMKPGAFSEATSARSQLEALESNVTAKIRASGGAGASASTSHAADAKVRRELAGDGAGAPAALASLEDKVTAKVRATPPASQPKAVAMLQGMEDSITAKVRRDGEPAVASASSRAQAHLQGMEDSIVAKTRVVASGSLAASGVAELTQLEGRIQSKLVGVPDAQQELSQFENDIRSKENAAPKADAAVDTDNAAKVEATRKEEPQEQALQPEVTTTADRGIAMAPDLEYGTGLIGAGGEGLAIAVAIEEDDDDIFIPSAVEYDPDAKPPLYKNRRFRLYAFLAFFTIVVVAVGASIATALAGPGSMPPPPTLAPTTARETLGIRSSVAQVVGRDRLDDPSSPYSKALDWMTFDDPLELTPEDPNFMQRYTAAYLYFATTVDGPWMSCNPPKNPRTDTALCSYKYLSQLLPPDFIDKPSSAWLSSAPECQWAGVVCNEQDVIRSIDLAGGSLTGPFPEGVVYFPMLQDLGLFYNNLTGTLPPQVGEMSQLLSLYLHYNKFTGGIPDEWWQATNLQNLNLGNNKLAGTIPTLIGKLRDLKNFFLFQNQFTGTIPSEIGLLDSVSFLRIDTNQLEGTIPSTITNLKNAIDLMLGNNKLAGPIPEDIGRVAQLKQLSLPGNALTGALPESLWDLSTLRTLDLGGNRFTGTLSESIGKMAANDGFYDFMINDNQLKGPLPTSITLLTALGTLLIQGNDFTGTVPEALCALKGNDLSGILTDFQANCAADPSGYVELACPDTCCTTCCLPDGTGCLALESAS